MPHIRGGDWTRGQTDSDAADAPVDDVGDHDPVRRLALSHLLRQGHLGRVLSVQAPVVQQLYRAALAKCQGVLLLQDTGAAGEGLRRSDAVRE